jgi:TatD DNase family protein
MNIQDANYIDTHCHLDLYRNYKKVITDIEQRNTFVVAVTNIPSVFEQDAQILKSANVALGLGLHPQLVKEYGDQIDLFIKLLPKAKFIGEVGLDYQEVDVNIRKRQQEIFKRILEESAKYKDKVLSIHSRRASEDVVSLIGNDFPCKIILHWYSGSISTLKQAINNGYFFSINTSMIDSEKGQSIIRSLPLERILTETDGPFIKLNSKIVMPTDIEVIVGYLAKIHKKTNREMTEKIKNNFLTVTENVKV